MNLIEQGVIILIGVLLLAFPVLLVRSLVKFYRSDRRSGTFTSGLAGAMLELDRITRPSVQHVEQVEEQCVEDESIGGE